MQSSTGSDLLAALDLPEGCRVDQRVPKKLLLENGAPTAADKRLINDGIEELLWLATLKPTTIGVPEYRDAVREYLEIAVVRLTLRDGAKTTRLVELVHRAVPYPLLLLTERGERPELSAAHIRWSLGETATTVLDGDVVSTDCYSAQDDKVWSGFRVALAVGKQPHTTLYSMYQGWIDTLLALRAARVTGVFTLAANPELAAARRVALQECARLDAEVARLRSAAAKEKQIARRVEMNLELKRVEEAKVAASAYL